MVRFGVHDDPLSSRLTPKRGKVLAQLKQAGIVSRPCAPPATSGWLSYLGDIYFDVTVDPGEPEYERIVALFEEPDGTARDPEVRLCIYVRDD